MDHEQARRQALENPRERWIVFLHPSQQEVVTSRHTVPSLVAGAAGTGKTVVALHRAREPARRSLDAHVLLATCSRTLALRLKRDGGQPVGEDDPAIQRSGSCTCSDRPTRSASVMVDGSSSPRPTTGCVVGSVGRERIWVSQRSIGPSWRPSGSTSSNTGRSATWGRAGASRGSVAAYPWAHGNGGSCGSCSSVRGPTSTRPAP